MEGSLLEKHLMKDSDVYKFIFERKVDSNTIGIKGRRFLERYIGFSWIKIRNGRGMEETLGSTDFDIPEDRPLQCYIIDYMTEFLSVSYFIYISYLCIYIQCLIFNWIWIFLKVNIQYWASESEHQQYSTTSGAVFDGIFNDTGGQQGTAKLISLKKGYNGRLSFGETFN